MISKVRSETMNSSWWSFSPPGESESILSDQLVPFISASILALCWELATEDVELETANNVKVYPNVFKGMMRSRCSGPFVCNGTVFGVELSLLVGRRPNVSMLANSERPAAASC